MIYQLLMFACLSSLGRLGNAGAACEILAIHAAQIALGRHFFIFEVSLATAAESLEKFLELLHSFIALWHGSAAQSSRVLLS